MTYDSRGRTTITVPADQQQQQQPQDGGVVGEGTSSTTTTTTTDQSTDGNVPPPNPVSTSTPEMQRTVTSDSGLGVTSPLGFPNDTVSSPNDATTTMASVSAEELMAAFPINKLASLTNKISNTRWIVPVLPEQELECLLNAAIELTLAGCDHECDPCMRFYRDALTMSFLKILTDEAVNTWKPNIQNCILLSCGKLMQLCALHMKRDNPFLLDLLSVVLDPENKFHTFNASRQPEMFVLAPATGDPLHSTTANASGAVGAWGPLADTFAVPLSEPRNPKGWLVDLINRFVFVALLLPLRDSLTRLCFRFGQMRGFDNLLERFNAGVALLKPLPLASLGCDDTQTGTAGPGSSLSSSMDSMRLKSSSGTISTATSILADDSSSSSPNSSNKITLPLIHALLRPFGQCYELLTVATIERYFMPIWEVVMELLEGLSDDELKREAKPEGRSDSINGIVRAIRCLASRVPNQDQLIKELEVFRLKVILRLLQVSSFNGKMNALNEINKILSAVSCYPMRSHGLPLIPDDDMDWLTAERMAVSAAGFEIKVGGCIFTLSLFPDLDQGL